MMIPTLHRNGTSKEALTEALENAGHALRNAMNAIGETAPNGRDFYPQGDAAIRVAVSEHEARLVRLRTVLNEIEALHEAIEDGGAGQVSK